MWSPPVYPARQLVLSETPKKHETPNVRDHLAYGTKLVHISVASSLQVNPEVTSLPGDKPRASKVAASWNQGLARGK